MAAAEVIVGLALVGCAHIHTPQFVQMINAREDVKVLAVWDHDMERAEKRASDLESSATTDLNSVWANPDVKAVVIASETNRHEELVMAAAAAGKHMFVEKPLGLGAKDAYAMADAIEKAGVKFQTGYFQRGSGINQFVKEQLEKGSFGKVTRIRHTNCHSGSLDGWFDTEWRWMADLDQAGVGAFGDLGTHSLDLLLWMMGDVTSCTAAIDKGTGRYGKTDETGEGLMVFRNGTIGTIAAAWTDLEDPVSLEISGTEGHAVVVRDQLFFRSEHVEGADGRTRWTKLPQPRPHAFVLFLDAITGNEEVQLVSPREAAYRSAVMEAMYQGARNKEWVEPVSESR